MFGPEKDDKARNDEIRQNPNPAEREIVPVVASRRKNWIRIPPRFEPHPTDSGKIWPKRNRDSRQWRMFGFERVGSFVPPLNTAGNVRSLVGSCIRYVVGGSDAHNRQSSKHREATAQT